jgi:hypothetical protein
MYSVTILTFWEEHVKLAHADAKHLSHAASEMMQNRK